MRDGVEIFKRSPLKILPYNNPMIQITINTRKTQQITYPKYTQIYIYINSRAYKTSDKMQVNI